MIADYETLDSAHKLDPKPTLKDLGVEAEALEKVAQAEAVDGEE